MNLEELINLQFWLYPLHPMLMWIAFTLTLYALYLGIQIRRTRTATGETKKALLRERFNQRHYQLGSILLALMVIGTLGAMAVDYINNDQLFVGPHLLAGLGAVALMANAAALAPWMLRGRQWARNAHLGLAVLIVGTFGLQVVTGVHIIWEIIQGE